MRNKKVMKTKQRITRVALAVCGVVAVVTFMDFVSSSSPLSNENFVIISSASFVVSLHLVSSFSVGLVLLRLGLSLHPLSLRQH